MEAKFLAPEIMRNVPTSCCGRMTSGQLVCAMCWLSDASKVLLEKNIQLIFMKAAKHDYQASDTFLKIQ